MNIEELKRVIRDQRDYLASLEKQKLVERDLPFNVKPYLSKPNVLAILGVRRSGKSTLGYLLIKGRNFAYVDFSDDRLVNFNDFDMLTRAFYELYGDFTHVLIDEPQYVNGWELFVNRLRKEKSVIVTGSSSTLLSGELATALTGRHVDLILFPFSLREYLAFKGVSVDLYSTRSVSIIKSELENYLRDGGFPEALSLGKRVIPSIYNDVITKDVINRYRIRDVAKFKEFANSMVKYYSTEISVRKLANLLKLSTSTVEEWLNAIQESYLVFFIKRYSRSPKQFNNQRKVYVVDPGIINYITSFSYGGLMEDVVAMHLLRRNQLEGVYYLKGEDFEVDFVDEKEKELIQVSYVSAKDEINNNELKSLMMGADVTGFSKLTLISWDLEDDLEIEGKKVRVIPMWKYLLTT
ncbi:ATP-binding protein [Sulfolobus sp. S-194]|uniref:ATP-binding protein n=1 Tax=Sulfolobus sp. S-194 TaxID=2512240 RepID=UPI0014373635|nr:ATP-binding protein [Sulfolobus sp. S-194]QIW24491.1 ATP-binding protein [Sulfolobus sp. S-194]